MKKVISIFFIVAGILSITSCNDDFLELTDKNSSVEGNFFQNLEQYEQTLFGCYQILQSDNYCNIQQITEAMSDNCYLGQGTDGNDGWDEFEDRGNLNMFTNTWQKYNWGIQRCNYLLAKIPNGPIEPTDMVWLEAEAKFLRAYFNFDFVRLFGNVTLNTSEVGVDSEQVDPKLVYELIAKDLEYACENLPETYTSDWSGRATKWAAKSLLARVYLYYTGYYQQNDLAGVVTASEVRTHLDDVITKGKFGLVDDFRSLWPFSQLAYYTGEDESIFAGEANKEIVFSIKYTEEGRSESYHEYSFDDASLPTGNTWLIYMGPRGDNQGALRSGWGFIPVTSTLHSAYEENDMRSKCIVNLEEGAATIDDWSNYSSDQKDYTGLWQQKYQPLLDEEGVEIAGDGGKAWQYGQGQDFYAIRYSDVLLMASELNLGEANTKSQEYLNEVRKRALGEENFVEVPVTKDAIFEERRLEFAFEGIRYFDLLRYDGQNNLNYAKSMIDATSGFTLINGGNQMVKEISFRKETKGLLQIPKEQINLSEYLKQNAGWEQ